VGAWQLMTGEAPGAGGIGDHTAVLAGALRAAGEEVGLRVGTRPWLVDATLDALPPPRRILFQYAPQAWGARGMNLRACRWLLRRRRTGDDVRVFFHEPFVPFDGARLRRAVLAVATRRMAAVLLGAASRAYVSTSAWIPLLRPLAPAGLPLRVLPIPSTIPRVRDDAAVGRLRESLSLGGTRRAVVHFGTYGELIAPLLLPVLERLTGHPGVRLLLLGRGGPAFAARLRERLPEADPVAPGELAPRELSLHLQAADAALQPYPDGVDTRRTTMMACIAHGLPTATTEGRFTDDVWRGSPVALAATAERLPDAVLALLRSPLPRGDVRAFYEERFSVEHSVRALMEER
jgi:glycosyltransferase involved in cell wall biosynthesis